MKKYLILPFFLFFLVLTVPSFAYYPLEINATYSGGLFNNNWLACSNVSGTFYCYKTGTPSGSYPHIYIERYNATWDNREYCDSGLSGSTYITGLFIANSTHIGWTQTDGTVRLLNATDEAFTDNVCTPSAQLSANLNTSYPLGCGYFDTDKTLYCGKNNGIRNSTTGAYLSDGFWSASVENLKLPNQTNDSTIYGTYENLFFKFIDGSFVSNPIQIDVGWGIPESNSIWHTYYWDLFKEGSTTWLYVYSQGRLYKANFTIAETLGESYIVAVSPIGNQTIADTTPELHVIVYSAYNGTVGWYMDGNFKANNTVTTDGVSVDAYYTTDTLTEGQHYWNAYYYPNEVGYNWTTGTQYFIIDSAYEGSDYSGPDIVEGFGSYLDSSLQTPYGGEIFALIFSGLVAGVIWYYSGSRKLEYLIAPMFFILACFSFIGLFPIWFLVLEVMVIAIFIFFKVR